MTKGFFGMQINIKAFYKLVLSFWVGVTRHVESTQNKMFSYLCNISRSLSFTFLWSLPERQAFSLTTFFCLLFNQIYKDLVFYKDTTNNHHYQPQRLIRIIPSHRPPSFIIPVPTRQIPTAYITLKSLLLFSRDISIKPVKMAPTSQHQ